MRKPHIAQIEIKVHYVDAAGEAFAVDVTKRFNGFCPNPASPPEGLEQVVAESAGLVRRMMMGRVE